MRSPWKRLAAVAGFVVVPLSLGPVSPARAGGGFGITVAATMDGQDQRLLVGTLHTLHVTVLDAPGEASLRDILVTVVDPDPTAYPVVCDAGVNGHMSLEPMRALHCTTEVSALVGEREVDATATATVPGMPGRLRGFAAVHYFGFMPPPPPPKPEVKPDVKPLAKPAPANHVQAGAKPHDPARAPHGAQNDPPAGDPPAGDGGARVPGTVNPPPPGRGAGDDDPGCPGGVGGSGAGGVGGASSAGGGECVCPPAGDGDAGTCQCPPRADGDQHPGTCPCPPKAVACDPGDPGARVEPPQTLHRLARTGTDVPLVAGASVLLLGGGGLLAQRFRKSRG